jgi:hypothetical protein
MGGEAFHSGFAKVVDAIAGLIPAPRPESFLENIPQFHDARLSYGYFYASEIKILWQTCQLLFWPETGAAAMSRSGANPILLKLSCQPEAF